MAKSNSQNDDYRKLPRKSRLKAFPKEAAPATMQEYCCRLDLVSSVMDGLIDRQATVRHLKTEGQKALWQLCLKGNGSPLHKNAIRILKTQNGSLIPSLTIPVCPFEMKVSHIAKELTEEDIIAWLEQPSKTNSFGNPRSTLELKRHALTYWTSAAALSALSPVDACGFFGVDYRLAVALSHSSPMAIWDFVDHTDQELQFTGWKMHDLQQNAMLALVDTITMLAAQKEDVTSLKRALVAQILAYRSQHLSNTRIPSRASPLLHTDTAIGIANAYAELGCTGGVLSSVLDLADATEVQQRGTSLDRSLTSKWKNVRKTYEGHLAKEALPVIQNAITVATGGSRSKLVFCRALLWASSLYISIWSQPGEKPHAVLEEIAKLALTSPRAAGGRHFPQKTLDEENSDD